MSKRRRTSSIASRPEDESSSLDSESATLTTPTITMPTTAVSTTPTPSGGGGGGRKRFKKQDPSELVHQIYELIRTHKKSDGALLCDAFIRVPKRRQEPGYYEVVTNPIDLLRIQQKLKTDEYETIDDLQLDVELVVNNAKAFYKKSSQEWRDAGELWDLFLASKQRLLDSTNLNQQFIDHFNAICHQADTSLTPFIKLPSKSKYPQYYEIITQPIDLKTICTKISTLTEYESLPDLDKDLLLLCKNACQFNETGSKIYKSAKIIKKLIINKPKNVGLKISQERNFFQEILNDEFHMSDDSDDSDDDASSNASSGASNPQSDEETEENSISDPKFALIDAIFHLPCSEGFIKLPSKKFQSEYYREIKNPLSLEQIRRKLAGNAYGTVSEVAGDLTVMCENAKRWHQPGTKLYKDAVKLQKAMQTKVQELLDLDHQESDADDGNKAATSAIRRTAKPFTPGQRGRPPKDPIPLKKRLHALAKFLLDYTTEDGRKPMMAFMEKPSKKLYPDYYEIIAEPIDFLEIESKIRGEQYANEAELIRDFKLMFANCRCYNEENSPIYDDALLLEKVLVDKFGCGTPEKRTYTRITKPRRIYTPLERNLKALYDYIKDYREPKQNRQLSTIFVKLPSKSEYPDYFDIITQPIDLDKIHHQLRTPQHYASLNALLADLNLMFDNACKYNEPDSQIYKDALVLQKLAHQKKLELTENEAEMPCVSEAVQDLLLSLFTGVYNWCDGDERCYSDSMSEVAEHDDLDGKKVRALSLDLIKRRLDKGLYKRLDTFQDDFFSVLQRARHLSRTDSQIFEDACEMQQFFVKLRDELCRNGELLHSPALQYTIELFASQVEVQKSEKQTLEVATATGGVNAAGGEDESETRSSEDSLLKLNLGETMICNSIEFKVGDFVYLDAKEDRNVEPHILLIERLWTNEQGAKMLYGNYYLRPAETYHLQTRKFLEKETFKSDQHIAVALEEVRQRCCVMNVKQYFTLRPEGFDEKDVFVCESRYSTRLRNFKKIKVFPESANNYTLVPREQPIEPKRVMSIFRERVEKHKDELAELQEIERMVEKEKPNVIAFNQLHHDSDLTFYEQYTTICAGSVKIGDFVYVLSQHDPQRQTIAQIDSIWETKTGKGYFRGPWFITPQEVAKTGVGIGGGLNNAGFYEKEVFLSTLEDTNPLVSIVGRCAVLEYSEYISCRPTEIPESDVYICTSLYDEINRQLQKLPPDGLKKYQHSSSNLVTEDEIYFFPKLINPARIGGNPDVATLQSSASSSLASAPSGEGKSANCEMMDQQSPLTLTKLHDMDLLMMDTDSIDGPPSIGSGGGVGVGVEFTQLTAPSPAVTQTASATVKKKNKNKIVTGYILYSRDVRKSVVQNNPESSFGEISRIVGNEWRSLPANDKQTWEEKATRMNEESKLKAQQAQAQQDAEEGCASPVQVQGHQGQGQHTTNPDLLYECAWSECDFQFEDLADLLDHCIREKEGIVGHVQQYAATLNLQAGGQGGDGGGELQCLWRACSRNTKQKRTTLPFPSVARLIRHVRDSHINKLSGRVVAADQRNRNCIASHRLSSSTTTTTTSTTPSGVLQVQGQIQSADSIGTTTGSTLTTPGAAGGAATPAGGALAPKQHEPLFISVPPRPQRALHSEAYIKYIEGLHAENKFITNFERTLTACQENLTEKNDKSSEKNFSSDPEKIQNVSTWLGTRQNQQDNVLNALWMLRNQLLRDTLGLQKTL